jgi:transposase-like protein
MDLNAPHFRDDAAAREYFEKIRWPDGRVCPRCGSIGTEYETARAGRYRCGARECRADFKTTSGTVFESSKIGLSRWLWTFYAMCSSKKGISSQQVRRSLGVSAKTAWFMCHRVREAMKAGGLLAPLGGPDKVIEADETFLWDVENRSDVRKDGEPFIADRKGISPRQRGKYGHTHKRAVVALVERGGKARVFHVAEANRETIEKLLAENTSEKSRLHTDEAHHYKRIGEFFEEHGAVKHSAGEYVRGDIHNNSCESFFGVFKRGMKGVYQQCGEQYLSRYVTEFEFRFNNRMKLGVDDKQRTDNAIAGAIGKRLTFERSNQA